MKKVVTAPVTAEIPQAGATTSIPITKIVQVNISRKPRGEQYFAFNVGCILGSSVGKITKDERYKSFTSMEDVILVFKETDPEYKAAQVYFAQQPNPNKLIIAFWDKTGEATPDIALNDLILKNPDWYGLTTSEELTIENMINIGTWTESQPYKYYFCAHSSKDIFDSQKTDDPASKMKTQKFNKSALFAHPNINPAPAAFPRFLAIDWSAKNTAITLFLKKLSLVSPNPITSAQQDVAIGKNANTYTTFGKTSDGVYDGRACSSEWIDTMIGIDVLKNNIEVDQFNVLYQTPTKIPLTNEGGAILEAALRKTLEKFRKNGFIGSGIITDQGAGLSQLGYETYVQPVSEMTEADRSLRRAPALQFRCTLADAIHKIIITGIVQ